MGKSEGGPGAPGCATGGPSKAFGDWSERGRVVASRVTVWQGATLLPEARGQLERFCQRLNCEALYLGQLTDEPAPDPALALSPLAAALLAELFPPGDCAPIGRYAAWRYERRRQRREARGTPPKRRRP